MAPVNIEALILSAGEPQLNQCLESVKNQTVHFSGIIHIDNVVPEAEAFNRGIGQITARWFMHIAGDMILKNDAVDIVTRQIGKDEGQKVGQYHFGLNDPFIGQVIGACVAFNTEAVRSVVWKDKLRNDAEAMHRMQRRGWATLRLVHGRWQIVIGTHFENPDEFQIFRRYFIRGIKWVKSGIEGKNFIMIQKLYEETGKPEYKLAMDAMEYGRKIAKYPGSHNIQYDREMYESFLNLRGL